MSFVNDCFNRYKSFLFLACTHSFRKVCLLVLLAKTEVAACEVGCHVHVCVVIVSANKSVRGEDFRVYLLLAGHFDSKLARICSVLCLGDNQNVVSCKCL